MEATEVSTIDVDPTGSIVVRTDSPLDLDSPCQVKTAAFSLFFSTDAICGSVLRIKGHDKLEFLQSPKH